MQNWYSQNSPTRLMAVGEGKVVGTGYGVYVGIAATVAATACWISEFGSGVAVLLGAQAARIRIEMMTFIHNVVIFGFMEVIILAL